MKRSWLGAGLLVILLLGGILSAQWMKHTHEKMASFAREAAEAALEEDWSMAEGQIRNIKEKWQRCWHFSAAMSSHSDLEQIETLFVQLEVYARSGERVAYAASCVQLQMQFQALAEAQCLNWWNLL